MIAANSWFSVRISLLVVTGNRGFFKFLKGIHHQFSIAAKVEIPVDSLSLSNFLQQNKRCCFIHSVHFPDLLFSLQPQPMLTQVKLLKEIHQAFLGVKQNVKLHADQRNTGSKLDIICLLCTSSCFLSLTEWQTLTYNMRSHSLENNLFHESCRNSRNHGKKIDRV